MHTEQTDQISSLTIWVDSQCLKIGFEIQIWFMCSVNKALESNPTKANKWAHCCWSQPAKALPYMTTCYNAKDCLCPDGRHLNLSRHWLERSCASSSLNSSWAAVSILGGRFAPGFNHKQWAHSFASAPKDATHSAWTRARALQTKTVLNFNALFWYYTWFNTFQSYVSIGIMIWCA